MQLLGARVGKGNDSTHQRGTILYQVFDFHGESVGVRTRDLLIKSQLLYRLSYALPDARRFTRLEVRGTYAGAPSWSTKKSSFPVH